ncbi:hypothetical protein BC829DRAFT_413416, partial [Chytridium lagenaria]
MAKRVVTVSGDGIMRVFDTVDVMEESLTMKPVGIIGEGSKMKAIVDIAVHGDFFAIASEDGHVRCGSFVTMDIEKTITRFTLPVRCVALRLDDTKTYVRQVAAAGDDMAIKIVDANDIEKIRTLDGKDMHEKPVKTLSFSPDGRWLVSTSSDGSVKIWDGDNDFRCSKTLHDTIPGTTFKRISWHPSGKFLAVPGRKRDIIVLSANTWKAAYTLKENSKGVTCLAWSSDGALLAAACEHNLQIWEPEKSKAACLKRFTHSATILGLAWHPNLQELCLSDNKSGILISKIGKVVITLTPEDELSLMFAEDNEAVPKVTATESVTRPNDDDGAGYAEPLESKEQVDRYYDRQRKRVKEIYGSAFNLLGVIHTKDQGTHCALHVDFHDKSQRGYLVEDFSKYTMACLNEHGVLLACDSTSPLGSGVEFRAAEAWSVSSTWKVKLGENPKAIALTKRGPVVATDKQELALMIIRISESSTVKKDALPISPGSTLEWIGFTDQMSPATYDSNGILRILQPFDDYDWVPFFDETKRHVEGVANKSHIWPVAVSDSLLYGVTCKGALRHPTPPFKGSMEEFQLAIPLEVEDDAVACAAQASYLQHHYTIKALRGIETHESKERRRKELSSDRQLIIAIDDACKRDKMERALDLAAQLYRQKSLEGVMKMAVQYRHAILAEKMMKMMESLVSLNPNIHVPPLGVPANKPTVKLAPKPVTPATSPPPDDDLPIALAELEDEEEKGRKGRWKHARREQRKVRTLKGRGVQEKEVEKEVEVEQKEEDEEGEKGEKEEVEEEEEEAEEVVEKVWKGKRKKGEEEEVAVATPAVKKSKSDETSELKDMEDDTKDTKGKGSKQLTLKQMAAKEKPKVTRTYKERAAKKKKKEEEDEEERDSDAMETDETPKDKERQLTYFAARQSRLDYFKILNFLLREPARSARVSGVEAGAGSSKGPLSNGDGSASSMATFLGGKLQPLKRMHSDHSDGLLDSSPTKRRFTERDDGKIP